MPAHHGRRDPGESGQLAGAPRPDGEELDGPAPRGIGKKLKTFADISNI